MSTPLGLPGKDLRRSRYRLLGLVGQGQFGRVYCAIHRRTGQLVALKDLDHERFPTHKFLRELRFLLSLEHPNIVTCHALEHTRTGRYLVMDYCEGGTLRSLMEEDTRLSLPQCIKLTADVLSGLEQAHNRGIVHCDIKPENILLNLEPHGWKARISDFGIARLPQEMGVEAHSGLGNTGSPAYMSPERFYGQFSKSSDLYSVGILLYELMAGDRPFSGTPGQLMSAHLNQPLTFPDSIPAVWHPILAMALQKLVARRFRSASEMLMALKHSAEAEGILGYLERQPLSMPLLQPVAELAIAPLADTKVERIEQPVTAIALRPEHRRKLLKPFPASLDLYLASGHNVMLRRCSTGTGEAVEPHAPQTLTFPHPIHQLISTPDGCCVVTERAVYRLPAAGGKAQLLAPLEPGALAVLTPSRDWLAIANPDPALSEWTLRIHSLRSAATPPRQVAMPPVLPQARVEHLVPLDNRHLVVLSHDPNSDAQPTWLTLMTRRGGHLGKFGLPIQVGQVVATGFPYRLIVSDRRDPQSLVTLDLKPYRITRFGLGMVPKVIAAAPWGYLVADATGQVLLLDEYGQRVGRLALPFPPTAMVPFNTHGILVATWNQSWGHLYVINLKTLEIDFLF